MYSGFYSTCILCMYWRSRYIFYYKVIPGYDRVEIEIFRKFYKPDHVEVCLHHLFEIFWS